MSGKYDRSGVSFAYPENWALEEDQDDEARLSLTLTSPGTAFWTLMVYDEPLDPKNVADQALEALRNEYPDLEASDASEAVADLELLGHDVNFICLDLTNTTRVRACRRGEATYLIFCQAEDREMETVDPVFRAITASLLMDV